jgi:hypothetical protein
MERAATGGRGMGDRGEEGSSLIKKSGFIECVGVAGNHEAGDNEDG